MNSALYHWLRTQFPRRAATRHRAGLAARLACEPLEPRDVPATFTVTNTGDSPIIGSGSLRAAILEANATVGVDDTIVFAPSVTGTITLTGGVIAITDSVTITGPGAAKLTVSGNGQDRIFLVSDGTAAQAAVSVSGLTLTRGLAPGVSAGGAVRNDEHLTLSGVVVTDSTAPVTGGGAVGNYGVLTITGCTFAGNSAESGGAVVNIIGNTATITASTFVGNTAADGGGSAVYNGGTLTVTASTFVGNTAVNGGGAVDNYGGSSSLSLKGVLAVGNTGGDVAGAYTGGFNLIGLPAGLALGDVLAVGAGGKPLLADNGGPTPTVALRLSGPAVDAGDPADTSSDQRGVNPVGVRDAGAFEAGTVPPETAIDRAPLGVTNDTTPTFTFSSPDADVDHFEVSLDGVTFDPLPDGVATFTPATALADGTYTLRVRAVDGAGNPDPTPAASTFRVDTVAPTATLTSAAPALIRARTFRVTATFSEPITPFYLDDIGVRSIIVSNGVASNLSYVTPTVFTFDVTAAREGVVTVNLSSAYVRDAAGNSGTPVPPLTRTHATPPTVTVGRPSAARVRAGTGAAVSYLVTYADANLARATLTAADVVLNRTGTANGRVTVARLSGTTFRVTVVGITGSGSLGVSIRAGTAVDGYGLTAAGYGSGAAFAVVPPFSGLHLTPLRR